MRRQPPAWDIDAVDSHAEAFIKPRGVCDPKAEMEKGSHDILDIRKATNIGESKYQRRSQLPPRRFFVGE
jgi:hypothetical protein